MYCGHACQTPPSSRGHHHIDCNENDLPGRVHFGGSYNSWYLWLDLLSGCSRMKFSFAPSPTTRERDTYYHRKSSHKDRAVLILHCPYPPHPSPALPFSRCSHLVMVGAELQTNSVTGPEHPSPSIELWQLGLPPDGESSVQTVIMSGNREPWGLAGMAGVSSIPTALQLAALKMRKGSLSSDMPPTDTGLASPGETACPQGWKATLAVDIWIPLMRPAQDGSSANYSNRPWCLDSSCYV